MSPFKRKELWKYITLHLNQTALPSPPTLSTSSSSSGWSECNRAGKAGGAKFAESNPRLSRVQRSQVVKSTPLILDNVFLIHVDCSTIFAMKASFRWIKRSGFFSQDVKTLHKRLDGQDTRNTKDFANISAKKSQWSDKSTDEKIFFGENCWRHVALFPPCVTAVVHHGRLCVLFKTDDNTLSHQECSCRSV